jgi:hypothetical protein
MNPPRWQFMTVKIAADGIFFPAVDRQELEAKLVELSDKGWQLASTIPEIGLFGSMRAALLIFKRPVTDL